MQRFVGYQEFFKEFIDLSCSPAFCQALKESIVYEIETVQRELVDTDALRHR